jgi:uncharacterized membrane protein
MNKNRLEAFSDGVLAIIITIMVLELAVPHGDDFAALGALTPVILSYVLSFAFLGVYWVNHHHLLHTVRRVTGPILWANLHLLFWLSLFPFCTAWMGEHYRGSAPAALYGAILFMASLAYLLLQRQIISADGSDSLLQRAIGSDRKGKLSSALYLTAIAFAFFWPWVAQAIYVAVALAWLVPDRRIERAIGNAETPR